MRHTIIRSALLACVSVFLMSCYQDLSTDASISLSDIEITSELERFDMYYGETFTFTPEVKIKGRKASSIEYKWEMTITPQDDEYELDLGSEKTLTYYVGNTPSSKPYIIRLTVKDKETGLARSKSWDAYVASSLGEGILVAHTADGGETSDLSLLKSKYVTEGYTSSPKITHNLFTLYNGAPIDGRVNALVPVVSSNLAAYNLNRVYIGTDTDLIAVNYLNYEEDMRNAALFQFTEGKETVAVEHLFNYAEYATGLISNGRFYNCLCLAAHLYTECMYHNTPSDIFSTATLAATKGYKGIVILLDVNNGSFNFMQGRMLGGSFAEIQAKPTYSLRGATPVACGMMKQDKAGYVIKASDGTYYATVLTTDGQTSSLIDYNISEIASDIADAKGFAFCDNTDFFYYFTDSKINVIRTVGSSPSHSTLSWKPENKTEKVTGLYHYMQGWYGTQQISSYEHTIDTHRQQMIITTYDQTAKEGKVYLYAFNPSTGLFKNPSNGIYGGFNEITAITPTLR